MNRLETHNGAIIRKTTRFHFWYAPEFATSNCFRKHLPRLLPAFQPILFHHFNGFGKVIFQLNWVCRTFMIFVQRKQNVQQFCSLPSSGRYATKAFRSLPDTVILFGNHRLTSCITIRYETINLFPKKLNWLTLRLGIIATLEKNQTGFTKVSSNRFMCTQSIKFLPYQPKTYSSGRSKTLENQTLTAQKFVSLLSTEKKIIQHLLDCNIHFSIQSI